MATSIAIPGQPLGSTSTYVPGPGTHITNKTLTSSLIGRAVSSSTTSLKPPKSTAPQTLLSIVRPSSQRPRPHLPAVGSIVYARITRLQTSNAHTSILAVDAVAVPASISAGSSNSGSTSLRGIVRAVDVRATEKDRVKLADCFAVGDVVRAVVVSVGDMGGYFLSTAGNEFGVVMAWSQAGNACVPVSWREVRDVVTGATEPRKVAKPF